MFYCIYNKIYKGRIGNGYYVYAIGRRVLVPSRSFVSILPGLLSRKCLNSKPVDPVENVVPGLVLLDHIVRYGSSFFQGPKRNHTPCSVGNLVGDPL